MKLRLPGISARSRLIALSFSLVAGSFLSPALANDAFHVKCKKKCEACESGNCEPSSDTYEVVATFDTDDPAQDEADANAEAARRNAAGEDCKVEAVNSSSNGGQAGDNSPGFTPLNYKRQGLVFQGVGPDYAKFETVNEVVNGVSVPVKKPVQLPAKNSTIFYSDLPDGSGYQASRYLNSQISAPNSNGFRTIPAGVHPVSITTYRNPDGSADTTTGKLDVIHQQRHPQSGAWVTRTIRKISPQGNNNWKTEFFLGNPSATSGLLSYREITISRTPHTDGTESTRETTRDRDSAGNLVITSDVSATYAFYKYAEPVKLLETKHTGTGSDLTTTWTYFTDRLQQASFNKPATQRRSDGQWANYTYQGSDVTGVFVTKTVSGWLDNPAPTIGTAPDENANRVLVEIEARNETGTFSREEKIQGVLVSKTWGERYKENSGGFVEKTRLETGTSTLLTIRTGYPDDASTPAVERGQVKSIQNPDGTVELHSHALQGTNRVVTIDAGAGTLSGVTDGTRKVSTYTSDDTLIKEVVSDITSGIELSAKEAIAFDSNGKPSRWAYDNNPDDYSETLDGCCGIDSTRNRDGIVTSYTRDGLKRPTTEISRGVTLTYTYGSRTIGGTVFPSVNITATAGSLTLDRGTTVYDHAGNVIQRISPDLDGDNNEEITVTTRAFTARTTTTSNPDGGTVIQTNFSDGQSKSTTGSATAPRYHVYTTHTEQGGGLAAATAPTATGPWTKIYANLAGRSLKTSFDNGTTETVLQTYGYDNLGRLVSTKDADNVAQLVAYNARGEGYRRAIDLNQNGQIDNADRVTDTLEDILDVPGFGPALRTRSIVYDDANTAHTVRTTLTSPDGLLSRQETLGVANPSNSVRAPHLDHVDGSWADTATAPDGTKQTREYSNWLPVTQSRLDTANDVIESTAMSYDALRRPEARANSRSASAVVTRTSYHPTNGLVVSLTEDVTTGVDRVSSFGYDSLGRRISVTLPDNSVARTSYWPTGNEKATWGSQTNPTVKLYDSEGRLTKLRTFRSTNLALAPDETTTGHDETAWIYNDRGQLQRKEYADSKGTNYTYTPGGRLLTRTWARNSGGAPLVTTYGYSTAGELTATDYSDATPDVAVAFDKLGRQQTITNGVATSGFTYDPNTLALAYETISYNFNGDSTADFTRVLDRSRDTLGRDTGFQLKAGSTIENEASYTYSVSTGRLATVAGTASPGAFTYAYTPGASLIASIAGPVHTVTNTWEATRNVLDLKENKIGTTVVSSYDYSVNPVGQRIGVEQTGSAFAATRGIVWAYDALGQVTSADHSTDNAFDRAYQYDAIGNRIENRDGTTIVSGTPNHSANALNQYSTIGSHSPLHDDDGNATNYPLPADPGSLSTLSWDAENRLISATVDGTTVNYLYDSQSRRIARRVGADTTVYLCDAWNVVAEYASSDLETFELGRTYMWGIDLTGTLQRAGGVGGLLAAC